MISGGYIYRPLRKFAGTVVHCVGRASQLTAEQCNKADADYLAGSFFSPEFLGADADDDHPKLSRQFSDGELAAMDRIYALQKASGVMFAFADARALQQQINEARFA